MVAPHLAEPSSPLVRWLSCALGAALGLLAGCGGDGGTPALTAYDYQGFWLMTSWTMDFDGTIDTLTRGGTPNGLLGDALVTATSATAAELSVRFAGLQDGVLMAAPMRSEETVVVEEGKWIVSNENDPADPADDTVSVYDVTLDGGDLTLDADPTDPRHVDSGGPLQIVLQRRAPWGTTATGSWWVSSVNDGTGPIDPGTCISEMTGPPQSATTSIELTIDDRWFLDQTTVTHTYGSNDCSGTPTTTTQAVVGYAEEEGSELRLWLYDGSDPAGSGYLVFALAPSGIADLTLTRTGCGPGPFCVGSPLETVLAPVP